VSAAPTELTVRPRKATKVARVLAVAVVLIFAAVATAMHGRTEGTMGVFQTSDQVAMVGLGLLAGAGILMFTRPRLIADDAGIRVRNVFGGYELPWDVVRAVTFNRGSPWASLELYDDDLVPVMAIQATDKLHAVESVRALRAMLAAHQAAGAVPAPREGA
jgi:Bacterial PH domain